MERITADEAARRGRGAGRIFLAGCTADPQIVVDAALKSGAWAGEILTGSFIPGINERGYGPLSDRVETIFSTSGLRQTPERVQHLPLHYTSYWDRLAQPGAIDLAYTTIPPPRPDGTVGFGICADFAPAPIGAGARLIGVVNPTMPDPDSSPRIPLSRFEALVEDECALPELSPAVPDQVNMAIAGHVISLLRDGDTIQLGLGRLQSAILARLAAAGLRDLGYHAGMIAPGLLPVHDAGVFRRGITTGVALGDAAFYADLERRTEIVFAPVSQTHGLGSLARLDRLVSVNSVLEVDLSGQANCEFLNGKQVSGHGGLVDFIRGARASPGGRSILALPARAKGGTQSRIVANLAPGTPVSVARSDVDIVVTEYGTAELREASLSERAERLARIAAPGFRESLLRAARDGGVTQ